MPQQVAMWNYVCIRRHTTAGKSRHNPEAGINDSRAGEFGIAYEDCHGPAETYVARNRSPLHRYDLHRTAKSVPSIVNPAGLPAQKIY